ncbi:hypothetical protein ACLOAV_001668 [Pseudogymnoascus australis]
MAPGYRNSNPSRRQTRGLVDHDIFEGLPVRNWRRDAVTVAPPPAHDPFATAKDKWDVELPWGMPKDAHLMPQHSQDLLRAARSGRIYQKRMLVEEEDIEADALLAEKAEKKEEAKEEGFVVRTWKLVPKHAEGPEIEYLAKRRKGLRGAPVKGAGATMTKMTLRRTDEAGNTYVEDVVVPEGHVVEGEVIATTVILDPAAAGAPAVGVAPPQPVKRRPPPPKRRAKGPGRGRRKKLPLPPRSAPTSVGAAQVDGQAAEAPKQEPAVDANGVKIESSVTPAPGNEDTEMGDGSMAPSDDEGEGDDRSEGSEDEDQDGEGEGSQTHDQDDDTRMVLDNLPPEPKVPAPKPAISGDFPVEAPHGEFAGQAGGLGATTGGSPLKHAFTPQSYSPTLSAEGVAENAPADAFGGEQLQGHFEQQQHQQQQQFRELDQQQHTNTKNNPTMRLPPTHPQPTTSAPPISRACSPAPPQFDVENNQQQEEGDEMLLDTVQGHDEQQLPDLSDFDPHASAEVPGGEQQGAGGEGQGEGPGDEKFEDLLGSLEEHLNDETEGDEPMALVGVEEAAPEPAAAAEAAAEVEAPAAAVAEAPAPAPVSVEETKPVEEQKAEEIPAAAAPEVVEPESAPAPAETEIASVETKEVEPAVVAEGKEVAVSPSKEESVVPEVAVAVETEEPAAVVVEEPAAPVVVEEPAVVVEEVVEEPQVVEEPKVIEVPAIADVAAEAVPEVAAPEEVKEEVKDVAPEVAPEPAQEVAKEVTPDAAKEGEAKKEEEQASEAPSAALSELLRGTSCKKFPRGTGDSPLKFKMDSAYDYYSLSKIDEDPDDLFEKTCGLFDEVREMMESENLSQARKTAYEEYTIDTMAAMIYGSNMIEKAGSTEDLTVKLCKDIFAGLTVPPEIPTNHPDYIATRTHLVHHNLPSNHKAITRSLLEITQHATAWTYLLTSLLSGPLATSHLLTTHSLLCTSLDLDDDTPASTYAGLYRLVPVCAGLSTFPPPSSVPSMIRTLVADYNLSIHRAKTEGFLDPFALAAEFAHRF